MVDYSKRRPVTMNHPARLTQTIRQAGDTAIRLIPGQSVVLR